MKITKALFIIFSLTLLNTAVANTTTIRYQYVTVVKEMLVQRALNISELNKQTPFDYIKTITKQAISNIKYSEIPIELSECVEIMKADLEQRSIYMSHQEIVETIVAAVNS
tara:strand:- start:99018 stop:99350 length:333 start_codon:yes stop_codon:yes gene_type:complete